MLESSAEHPGAQGLRPRASEEQGQPTTRTAAAACRLSPRKRAAASARVSLAQGESLGAGTLSKPGFKQTALHSGSTAQPSIAAQSRDGRHNHVSSACAR